MLDKKFFSGLKKEYIGWLKNKGLINRSSSEILRNAKRVIFAIHRDDMKEATTLLIEIKKGLKNLNKKSDFSDKLGHEGVYKAGLEEFVEAELFYNFVSNKKIGKITGFPIDHEVYLAGLSDFTGELTRRAVLLASKNNLKEVEKIKLVVEEAIHELIQLNMTGYLRTKFDQAKNNLKKIEDIIYQLSIRR